MSADTLKIHLKMSLLLLLLFAGPVFGKNPLFSNYGSPDPHMRVFNDRLFLYIGSDAAGPEHTGFHMEEWRIYSSDDLVNWKLERTITPKDNYMEDDSIGCWAGDAATRNGKYYFYFSDRTKGIGVMVADQPEGPYVDAAGKSITSASHDPTIFIDDDENKTPYIIHGNKNKNFKISRLNEDMISLAEEEHPIVITGELWERTPGWMDKNYLFKYKDTYYLSWGEQYATSKNIYGPYECVGKVGESKQHQLNNRAAHGSFFHWKGQFYHTWCIYMPTRKDQRFRETIITYCHMADDGKIVTDTGFLDKHFANGVGQYQADWDKIEAEWFYEKSETVQKSGESASREFVIKASLDGSWIRFQKTTFSSTPKTFTASFKGGSGAGGVLEIRLGSATGEKIGSLSLDQLNGAGIELYFEIQVKEGEHDLYLVFAGNPDHQVSLDWVSFK